MTATTDTRMRLAAAVFSLVLVIFAIARVSAAAFNEQTSNASNAFETGDVTITDDDSDTALFTLQNAKPGDGGQVCIEVSYTGSLDGDVELYGALTGTSGLEDYLDLTIESSAKVPGGVSSDCSNFNAAVNTTVYDATTDPDDTANDGTLGGFLDTHTDFASGAGTWAVTGGGADDVTVYRFTVNVQDDEAAEGQTADGVTFTWHARNN